ncbi:hypothetical protein PPSC2_26475 (plasmid) [Paenibacillus polymyxa SC2]|uniref:Uncharacterized protein n=1 Tax=Paenibacillus polymyxa (strain SC2) TaxID=886882 RepID=A0A0D5ZCQ7_PAEPS|nr:hypothetical protein PPSC2_26475 [Paenibacillus polymyxa SC2]
MIALYLLYFSIFTVVYMHIESCLSYVEFLPYMLIGSFILARYTRLILEDMTTAEENRLSKENHPLGRNRIEPLSYQKYYRKKEYSIADVSVILFYLPAWTLYMFGYLIRLVARFVRRMFVQFINIKVYIKRSSKD